MPNDFAVPKFSEVIFSTSKGQGQKSGVVVRGRFKRDDNKNLVIDLELENQTGGPLSQFDIMFNKNPFGISISGAST